MLESLFNFICNQGHSLSHLWKISCNTYIFWPWERTGASSLCTVVCIVSGCNMDQSMRIDMSRNDVIQMICPTRCSEKQSARIVTTVAMSNTCCSIDVLTPERLRHPMQEQYLKWELLYWIQSTFKSMHTFYAFYDRGLWITWRHCTEHLLTFVSTRHFWDMALFFRVQARWMWRSTLRKLRI